MGYLTGLVEGFQGRRNEEILRQQDLDTQRRGTEGKVFEYLLSSNDPEMRALALSGLFESAQPGKKKPGLSGYLGDLQGGQVYPMIRARMDEMVPDTGAGSHAPTPPASPGSAAMSTNAPVEAGSSPISMPPAPPELGMAESGPPTGQAPPLGPTPDMQGAMAPPPMAPPESQFKRRGTGVPTAEEVAESTARIQLETRMKVTREQILAAGGSEQDVQHALLGIAGAPQNQRQFAAPTFGVRLTPDGPVEPVSFDYSTGQYFLTDGKTPVPPGAEIIKLGGSAGAGLTTTIRDSPDVRAQYGIEPTDTTPSGYWKIKQNPDGSSMVMPAEYTPPPAYSGTTTILDAGNNPVVAGVPRGPVPGNVIGNAPNPQASSEQSTAQALLADVQARIAAAEKPQQLGRIGKPLLPTQRDQIVKEAATAAQLPYQTYFELEQATRIPPARQVTPRAGAPQGTGTAQPPVSNVDRIRQRALELQQGRTQAQPPPTQKPPVRATGAGPRR